MKKNLIARKSCPICGSELIFPHPAVGTSPRRVSDDGVVYGMISTYSRCTICGIVFQNPRWSDADLLKYYTSGEYHHESQEGEEDSEFSRSQYIYEYLYDRVLEDVPTSHLDIGCSTGKLLELVDARRKAGMDLHIRPPQPEGVVFSLDDIQGKRFSLITIIHTLEHDPYPHETLRKVWSMLKTDGDLVIEVPSEKSPGGPLRLAHLYYFEPWSLSFLLDRAGFKVETYSLYPHILAHAKRK